MQLFFDLDAGTFVTAPGTRETLTTIAFKRGDTCSIAVQFLQGVDVQELASGAAGRIGMKANGDYDGDYIAVDTAWTKTGTGTTTFYTFDLNLATTEIDTLLTGHTASITALFEMEFLVGSVRTSSNTVTATILNDVNKGDETAPLALPTAEEWLDTLRPPIIMRSAPLEDGFGGTAQVLTIGITAASGCTANGNLVVTMNGAHCGTSTIVNVALTTAAHTTADLIATAIRAALNASALARYYTFGGSTNQIVVTCIEVRANDATLALATSLTLGVTANTAVGVTAGVAPSVTGTVATVLGQFAMYDYELYVCARVSPVIWLRLTMA